jgi:hypothetical protein
MLNQKLKFLPIVLGGLSSTKNLSQITGTLIRKTNQVHMSPLEDPLIPNCRAFFVHCLGILKLSAQRWCIYQH